MALIDLGLWLVAVVLAVPAWIFFAECVAALLPGGPQPVARQGPRPRTVVLVPAHDEEDGLGATLDALKPQIGPGDRICVVADNCTDQTASVARASKVEVFERHDTERRGKGFAIVFGLEQLAVDPPEVVVIVDADCRLESGAIEIVARLARERQRPVQAEYLLASPKNSPGSVVSALAFLVRNRVRPRGLARFGLPAQLTGSGMAFPWDVIRSAPATGGYLVEDMLIGVELALLGKAPLHCAEAQVTSVLPDESKAALKQRKRWEHGTMQTLLQQAPRLFGRAVRRGDLDAFALGLDLIVPPLAFLVILLGLATSTTLVAALLGASWGPFGTLLAAFCAVSLGVLLAWGAYGRQTIAAGQLLAIPLYVFWKIPVYLSFLTRRQATWERTDRSQEAAAQLDAAQKGDPPPRP